MDYKNSYICDTLFKSIVYVTDCINKNTTLVIVGERQKVLMHIAVIDIGGTTCCIDT